MKQELKKIIGYLPYGVRIENSIGKVVNLNTIDLPYHIDKGFKLILRPLSDLNKEITVNGETFVPTKKMYFIDIGTDRDMYGIYEEFLDDVIYFLKYDNSHCPKVVLDRLYEWHFDIHNLIEQGKAINLNDLEL